MASYLTDSQASLWSGLVFGLSDYTFSPLTQSREQYLATAASGLTGQSYSHLTTSFDGLLAAIATELSGATVSNLSAFREFMLATVVNNPPSSTPAWLEAFRAANGSLPIAIADFINTNYWADGAEVANPNGFFTVAPTIGAQGMVGYNGQAAATGDFLAAFQDETGFTLLIEFENDSNNELADFWNSPGGEGLFVWTDGSNKLNIGNYTSETDEALNLDLNAGEINRIVITVKSGAVVYSLNGSAPTTMTTADVVIGAEMNMINSIEEDYIRVFAGYAALPDNNLAALSAL